MKKNILALTIALTLPTGWAFAQNPDGAPRPPRDGERPAGGTRDGDQKGKDGPRDGQRPPGAGPIPLLHALDKDDDGIISADEIKNAPDALKQLDKDSDGKLSREEWQPQPPRPPEGDGGRQRQERKSTTREGNAKPGADGERPAGPPVPPLVHALDTDGDGIISADEIGKSPESLAKLDQNNDGQLGPREYGPRPPQGPRDGGGKEGDRPADKKEK